MALLLAISLLPLPAVARDLDAAIGKAVFDRLWIAAPASTKSADGLGPLFAARSCAACHPRGGRAGFWLGRDDPNTSPGLVVRLGDAHGRPDPVYGAQLQPDGAAGVAGEGRVAVTAALKPDWRVESWAYAAPDPATRASARVAPSLVGAGLIARVSEAAILAGEDPDDRNSDGVSGRANRIGGEVGRFGWKAAEPTLQAQVAAAFSLDLGLSTDLRPDAAGDCTSHQPQCRAAPQGAEAGAPEVRPELMAGLLAFLERRPAPAAADETRGASLFSKTGCAACHAPRLPLAGGGEAALHSDLLLHDMGSGLDDGVGEGDARPAEWRTAPLLGLSRALAKGAGLMHDGRAKDVAEAVRWHQGEAAGAQVRFDALSGPERAALLDYVNGL